MASGSVRDRIKAAEALQGDVKGEASSANRRRGQRLSLKTDEHIKEEFLRRSDGGWHKKVDIGQQEEFTPPAMPPIIKLTADTPVITKPQQQLPGKLSKNLPKVFASVDEEPGSSMAGPAATTKDVPGAFEPAGEASLGDDKGWSRVEKMEAEQQAAMDAEAAKNGESDWGRTAQMEAEQQAAMDAAATEPKTNRKGKIREHVKEAVKRNVPTGRFESLLDQEATDKSPAESSKRASKASKTRQAHVASEDEAQTVEETLTNREKVLFDPVEYAKKKQARRERRASQQPARRERLLPVDEVEDNLRARSRSAQAPSIRLLRVNDNDDIPREERSRKDRSRSGSKHKHNSEQSPQIDPRRSSGSLWPSFSDSRRRSVSDMFELGSRPRSSHKRTPSDEQSVTSTQTKVSVKGLEFAGYVAGKKLEHVPATPPPKSPTRPMGFVRSKSHTGEYFEGYTREKKLLRKPSDDEVIEDFDHDWVRSPRSSGRRVSSARQKDEPWQVKLLQEIARR